MDQPMSPEMAAMPPEAMPPEAMPPEAMPPSADDVVAAAQQEARTTAEMYLNERPAPTSAYDIKVVGQLVNELNKLLESINDSAGQMLVPPIAFEAPAGQTSWNQPLPDELWLNIMAIAEAAVGIDGGRFADKHGFDPRTLVDTGSVRRVSAKLRMMAKDKAFIEALSSVAQGAAQAAEPMPPEAMPPEAMEPEMMPEDDALLQEAV